MGRMLIVALACGLASSWGGGTARAQSVTEVTVQATRVVQTHIDRSPSGVPISDVSISYGVTFSELDLASPAGAAQLEQRVKEAALQACREIGRLYPDATPKDEECAKAATEKAMIRVRELEAAAARHPGR